MSLRERVLRRVRRWTRRALDRLDPPEAVQAPPAPPPAPAAAPRGAARIQAEVTPNPNARKFVIAPSPGWTAPRSFVGDSGGDPMGAALLAIDGVASAFAVDDFVTVIKTPGADWGGLEPRVHDALRATLP